MPPFNVGDVLAGRYRMVTRLGRYGEGEIWWADDLILATAVALKIIPSSIPSARGSLIEEVRIARQITHPSVCRVFDFGDTEAAVFLSMELVQGEDLGTLLKRAGRLPSDRVAAIAHELCSALGAAHAKGVFHRNLKPANILIDQNGHTRIKDFGAGPTNRANDRCDDDGSSARNDVYAIGAVLFELVTGQPPHEASDRWRRAQLYRVAPDISPRLVGAILASISHDSRRRPVTARAMAALLADISDTGRRTAASSRRSRRRGISTAAATVVTGFVRRTRTAMAMPRTFVMSRRWTRRPVAGLFKTIGAAVQSS
jgi:serine/threonine protein kinase